jgi:hypothetical protein
LTYFLCVDCSGFRDREIVVANARISRLRST